MGPEYNQVPTASSNGFFFRELNITLHCIKSFNPECIKQVYLYV